MCQEVDTETIACNTRKWIQSYFRHQLKAQGATSTMRDPVCGMEITDKRLVWQLKYKGQTYHFCTVNCKRWFEKDPERYICQEKTYPQTADSAVSANVTTKEGNQDE